MSRPRRAQDYRLWVHTRNGIYYAALTTADGPKRWSLGTRDREIAERRRDELVRSARVAIPHPVDKLTVREWATKLHRQAKSNGISRGLSFTITRDFVAGLFEKQNARCLVSGIEFDMDIGVGRRPWVPSLDRIDSSKGYDPDNVRLVCMAVNFAMGSWGDGVFWRMVREAANEADRLRREKIYRAA